MGFLAHNGRIRASTLLEAIVASVIFLAVFAIGLETAVRLTLRSDGTETYIAMENRLKAALQECMTVPQEPGTTEETHPWGMLTREIRPYGAEEELQQIVLTARSQATRQRIEFRRIIRRAEEEP